jgi:hypothetical protein
MLLPDAGFSGSGGGGTGLPCRVESGASIGEVAAVWSAEFVITHTFPAGAESALQTLLSNSSAESLATSKKLH